MINLSPVEPARAPCLLVYPPNVSFHFRASEFAILTKKPHEKYGLATRLDSTRPSIDQTRHVFLGSFPDATRTNRYRPFRAILSFAALLESFYKVIDIANRIANRTEVLEGNYTDHDSYVSRTKVNHRLTELIFNETFSNSRS